MPLFDHETLPRGVWKAPYRANGCPVLLAITSRGERLKSIVLVPGTSEERVAAWLETVLDRHDPPPPPLRLVRPSALPTQLPPEEIEALYRDADPVRRLLWQRKRASMRGGTFG